MRLAIVMAAMVTMAVACDSGGDDEAEPTIPTAPETTTPETTTARPDTTSPPTTEATTTVATVPPTTTEDDLKAQIAADYVRSWELREEIALNPTLDNLDARVAEIAAVGTPEFDALRVFVEELVATGERVVPNEPDVFTVTVKGVTLLGSTPYKEADVLVCYVDNRVRVDAAGQSTGASGELFANQGSDSVSLTDLGWLPDGDYRITWTGLGVTECPPT